MAAFLSFLSKQQEVEDSNDIDVHFLTFAVNIMMSINMIIGERPGLDV
jgi:hypothetical protein